MKGILLALFGLSLLFAVPAVGQFVKSKDLEKMKKRTRIVVIREVPNKTILKQLNSSDAEDYRQALTRLNHNFLEVVQQFWHVNGTSVTIEQGTEKTIARLRKKNDYSTIVLDCQSLHVRPSKSHYAKTARTYTTGLSWRPDKKDLSVPVINMYFVENDVAYPFYIQNMSERFPDYIDLAVGIRLAMYVFSEQLDGRSASSLQAGMKHNAVFLQNRTLLLCRDWLDESFVESTAKAEYPFPIKFIGLSELENYFRKNAFDSAVLAYVPAGVFSTFDPNAPSMEVHVPVVMDPENGMPLCHTDISDEMFQAWGYSLIPKMTRTIVGFRKIRNEDIRNFAKSYKE